MSDTFNYSVIIAALVAAILGSFFGSLFKEWLAVRFERKKKRIEIRANLARHLTHYISRLTLYAQSKNLHDIESLKYYRRLVPNATIAEDKKEQLQEELKGRFEYLKHIEITYNDQIEKLKESEAEINGILSTCPIYFPEQVVKDLNALVLSGLPKSVGVKANINNMTFAELEAYGLTPYYNEIDHIVVSIQEMGTKLANSVQHTLREK